MPRARLVLSSLLVLGTTSGCAREATVFVNVPLADALARAGRDKKVVFLEFGAVWCEPCKRLQATTLVDPRVVRWLGEHTIALQFDIDKDPELAKEFDVTSVPAMVFVRPDRTVLGTITGYRDAEAFLAEAARRIQGTTALAEATAKVQADAKDVDALLGLFRELNRAGKHAEALAAADRYWQSSRGTAHGGVRLSFFLSDMERLAERFAPAGESLRRWFAEARDHLADKQRAPDSAQEMGALARLLHNQDEILEVLEQSKDRGLVQVFATMCPEVLLEARKYQLLVDSGSCAPSTVKEQIGTMQTGMKESRVPEAVVRRLVVDTAARPFEALAGTKRDDEALEVAAVVLGGDDDAEVRSRLATAAERAGNAGLAARVRERR